MSHAMMFAARQDAILADPEVQRACGSFDQIVVVETVYRVALAQARATEVDTHQPPRYSKLLQDPALAAALAAAFTGGMTGHDLAVGVLEAMDLAETTAPAATHDGPDVIADLRAREQAVAMTLPAGIASHGVGDDGVRTMIARLDDLVRIRQALEHERDGTRKALAFAIALQRILEHAASGHVVSETIAAQAPYYAALAQVLVESMTESDVARADLADRTRPVMLLEQLLTYVRASDEDLALGTRVVWCDWRALSSVIETRWRGAHGGMSDGPRDLPSYRSRHDVPASVRERDVMPCRADALRALLEAPVGVAGLLDELGGHNEALAAPSRVTAAPDREVVLAHMATGAVQ
jgi:hypothetical protein